MSLQTYLQTFLVLTLLSAAGTLALVLAIVALRHRGKVIRQNLSPLVRAFILIEALSLLFYLAIGWVNP